MGGGGWSKIVQNCVTSFMDDPLVAHKVHFQKQTSWGISHDLAQIWTFTSKLIESVDDEPRSC